MGKQVTNNQYWLSGNFINSILLSAIPSDGEPQWLLPNFVKEKMNPFPTAYSEAINYIHKNFI